MPLYYRNANHEDAEFACEAHSVRRGKARPHQYKGPQNTVHDICVSLYLVDLLFFSEYLRHALVHGDYRKLAELLQFNFKIMGNWRQANLLKLICPKADFEISHGSIAFRNTPLHWGFDNAKATEFYDAVENQHPEHNASGMHQYQLPKPIEKLEDLPVHTIWYSSNEGVPERLHFSDRRLR